MKNILFIPISILLSFQFSYADVTESCRLGGSEITVEDGMNGGIAVGLVMQKGQTVGVSDDIQTAELGIEDLNNILTGTVLRPLVDSLYFILKKTSVLRVTKIASDAVVIRFLDQDGKILIKIGQIQIAETPTQAGVCMAP